MDGGTNPFWDVGGVSGAELIGSSFTVTFDDGTTATGQLQGAGNQAGAQGVASQSSPDFTVSLSVNGLAPGEVGTYEVGGPSVIINGEAGQTARVVLSKGIIQPVNNNFPGPYGDQLDAQLAALAASDFPANNAAEFQTVDIVLTGQDQDITSLFDFSQVAIGQPLAVPEDTLPLAFVASVIDPGDNNLPLGPVTAPVYLTEQTIVPTDILVSIASTADGAEPGTDGAFTVSLSEASASQTVVAYSVSGTATSGDDFTALSGTVTIAAGATSAVIPVEVLDDLALEPSETVIVTLTQVTAGESNVVLAPSPSAQISIADDEVPVPGGDPVRVQAENFDSLDTFFIEGQGAAEGSVIRVNAGQTGTATLDLAGAGVAPGVNTISVTFFDENDGESTLIAQLVRGGQTIPVGTILFNQDGGGNAAQAQNLRTVDLPAVEIQAGDQLQLVGTSAGANGDFEFVRVDYVDFTPAGGGTQPGDVLVSIASTADGAEPGTDGAFTVSLSEASASQTVVAYSVSGTATSGDDFTALSGTVTIAAGATSAVIPVEVLDDLALEPSETVIVTLTQVTAGESNVVLAPSPSAQISIADDEVPVPGGDPVRVQAENFDSLDTFFIEGQGAAEGSVIRVNAGQTGTATLDLAGAGVAPGVNTISVTFFDENDGESTLIAQLVRGGQTIPVGTILFNQDGGGNAAQAQNLRTVDLPAVEIQAGDQLQLVGTSAGANGDFEFVRVDYVDFTPEGGGTQPPQNQAPVVDVPIPDLTVGVGEAVSIVPDFSDPDFGDSLVFSVSGLPSDLGFNPNTGAITGATQQTGTFTVDVTGADLGGLFAVDSFVLTVDPSAPPPPPSAGDFLATTVSPLDDLEIGNNSSLNSPDLETDLDFRVSLTIEEGVSGVTAVDRASLSWVSERAQSGDTTLQVQAADSLGGLDLTDTLVFTSSSSSIDIAGSWSNGQQITDIADITDLVNEVIASNGPLDAGDVITLQVTGEDAVKRFIDQQSITLSLSPLDEI